MIKVFIVEDHQVVREGLEYLLQADPHINVIGVAGNGKSALSLLGERELPDIVLTDLHLGDTTGIELAQNLKQNMPDIKVIMLTMETDERYLSEAFRAGIKGYVLKETAVDELIFAIRKVSEGRHFICTGLAGRLSRRLSSEQFFGHKRSANIKLSQRETEILQLLSDGYTNMQIADRLFTSKRTVEGHRQSLLNKAGVRNTPELIKYALLHGLLEFSEAN